jgi:hypothetical protein
VPSSDRFSEEPDEQKDDQDERDEAATDVHAVSFRLSPQSFHDPATPKPFEGRLQPVSRGNAADDTS